MIKEKIIFDTDMDTDCDDVGALVMLLKYAKAGKIDLLGIINDAPCTGGGPVCGILCDYYGYHCPIGVIYDREYPESETGRYVRYRRHRLTLPEEIYYNRVLPKTIGKTDEDYRPSYEVYREILSKAEDNSVTIVAVGFYTAIEALFNSGADKYSELNGYELFKKKVRRVISMGRADYPRTDNYNFNYNMDRVGAKAFFDRCHCSVYVSPDGEDVITGTTFADRLAADNPMRQAYEIYNGGPNHGRSSWDLIATLYVLEPELDVFNCESHGRVVYHDEDNSVSWTDDGKRTDFQITKKVSSEEMADILERILVS